MSNEKIIAKTKEEILKDLEAAVEAYNTAETIADRMKAAAKEDKAVKDYNAASLADAYATYLEEENPMLAFIKAYTYKVASVKIDKTTKAHKVDAEGEKVHTLEDFIDFAAGLNRNVTTAISWKARSEEARKALLDAIEAFIENGTKVPVGDLKSALQTAFDAVITIPGKNGNNAIVVKSKNVRAIVMASSRFDAKKIRAYFAEGKTWASRFYGYLHNAVDGKDISITYGDDDDATLVIEDEAEAGAESNDNSEA